MSNDAAQSLYRTFGFVPAGVRKGYYVETKEDALIMWAYKVHQPAYGALLDALVARAAELEDVRVVHLHCEGPGPHLAPEMAPHFRHRALFIGPNARAAIEEGRAEYVPVFLSDVPRCS